MAQQPWDPPRRSSEKHVLLSTPGVDSWDQQEIPGSGENLNVDPSFPKLSSYSDKRMYWCTVQGGPLPVISRVITPSIGVVTAGVHF